MDRRPNENLPERGSTVRESLRDALAEGPLTSRELSERVGVRERDVEAHLEHLERSAGARGERLVVEPARCIGCGFVFETRTRLGRPGKCPRCRGTRVAPPRFSLG